MQVRRRGLGVIVCGLIALGLLAPSGAAAAKKVSHYEGSNGGTPERTYGFDYVRRSDGRKFVKNFWIYRLAYGCNNATSGYYPWTMYFPHKMAVKNRQFEGTADEAWANGDPNTPYGGDYSVEGTIVKGGTAFGQYGWAFSPSPGVDCAGSDGWSATKVASP